MMFDDDDGVEPQFKVVDEYYFEHSEDEAVCFSILPLHFDSNEEVVNCGSEKKVYLRGVLNKSPYLVHKRVVAWRVELDCEQPKIFVLSGEGNWITILRPRKCYKKKIARSILITVQMLHFIKKQFGDRLWGRLWDHLYEVFKELGSKPTMDDLRKHHPLIKRFVETNPALIKSKILRSFIEDTTGEIKGPKTSPITKAQFIVGVELHSSSKDNDDKNDYDYSYNEHDSDHENSYSESSTEDDYNYSENNSNGDDMSDGHTDTDDCDNDNCTDAVCAICDDGGKLLSCIGHCKRSFHPRVKDGRESKCRTLGYTSAQLKGISDFLCQNCKYKQHQCFKCGELEPSDGLNAKVFKCNNASCGHFYHPKCVAKLLEPDDGACELAKRIISGMSFTCPVHWCFKCGKMEDRTQRGLQFAVCRRCPKSYHRECLPRNISFESKGKLIKRAWDLSNNILIYCRNHGIYRTTGTAGRNHIKLPCTPEVSKKNYPVKKKVKTNGNREKGIHQRSIKSTELLNKLCTDEIEENPKLTVINPEHVAKCLKEDPQCEPSVVRPDASPGSLETVKGLEKQSGTSLFAKGSSIIKNTSCALDRQLKNRVMSKSDKETSSGITHGIARKHVMPSTLGICGRTDQDIISGNSLVEKDAECVRIAGDKDDGERVKTSGCYAGENGSPNKDFHENREQNHVLDNFSLEKHSDAEANELKSRKEGAMEWGNNASEHDSISGQEKVISTCKQDSGSQKGKVTSNGGNKCGSGSDKVTPDHIDDHPPQKPLNVAHVDKTTIINITDTKPEYGCGEDREVKGSYSCQVERNNSQCNKNPKTIDTAGDKLIKRRETKGKATDGKKAGLNKNNIKYSHIKNGSKDPCEDTKPVYAEAHSKSKSPANHKELDALDCKLKGSGLDSGWYNDDNAAENISKWKAKRRAVPNRRDEMGDIRENSSKSYADRNARKRLRSYSQGQEMDHRDSYPGTSYRQRYEQKRYDNYFRFDYVGWRQKSPQEYSPDFGADRRRSPPYLGRQEHSIPGRCGRRGPEYVPSGRHSPPSRPRTLEDINYTTHWESFYDLEYDEYRHSRSHVSPTYPYTTRPEYGRRHTPPFHLRSPDIHQHFPSRRYSPHHCPRRSEHVDYTLDWNNPARLHYDQYDEYGGYSEMDIDPVARHSLGDKNDGAYRPGMNVNMEESAATYVGPVRYYGEESLTPKASGPVTDKYAPRLY